MNIATLSLHTALFTVSTVAGIFGGAPHVNHGSLTQTPTSSIIHLTTCPGALTRSGSYILGTDLTQATPTTPCISVHGVSGISINCAGHSIAVRAGPVPISFYNASNFAVKNCKLPLPIGVTASNNGSILNNRFSFPPGSGQSIRLSGSNLTFRSNTITNGVVILKTVSSATVTANAVSADPTVNSATISGVIELDSSNNNTLTNNRIDGNWHSTPEQGPGADDGFMLRSSSGNYVANNSIQNVFDCGIETIGQASDEQFLNNTITNAGYCGIGGWFWNSWLNNTVQGNVASDTRLLFQMYVNTDFPFSSDKQPATIYFKDNHFTSNIFSSGTPSNTNSANINYASEFLPAGITAVTGNNSFKSNNFSKFDMGPSLRPQSMIVDLGGNICAPIHPSDPPSIVCH